MRTIRELIGDTIREFFNERDVKKEIRKIAREQALAVLNSSTTTTTTSP